MNPVTVQMIVKHRQTELLRDAQKYHQFESVQQKRPPSQEQANRRQMLYLFGSNFVILFTGMGLFPLLPLYAAQFGASPEMTGLYLGIVYTAIAAGTLLTGWLANRLSPRGLFIGGSALGIPALLLLGQADAFWQVVVLTSTVWFSGGVGLALISVFTGRLAASSNRGKSFGLLFLTTPLGALVGGAFISQLVAWQGYPLMFAVLGVLWAALPIIGLFRLKVGLASQESTRAGHRSPSGARLSRTFYLLLFVSLLSGTALSASRIGTSLLMQAQGFSAQAIVSTATVSGLFALPLILLVRAFSDRVRRTNFLLFGYLLTSGAALVLGVSGQIWHFWLAASLVLVAMGIYSTVAPAFATDFLAPEALNRGLSWLNTSQWLASILSFTGSGYIVARYGTQALALVAAILPIIAFILLGVGSWRRAPVQILSSRVEEIPCPALEGCV